MKLHDFTVVASSKIKSGVKPRTVRLGRTGALDNYILKEILFQSNPSLVQYKMSPKWGSIPMEHEPQRAQKYTVIYSSKIHPYAHIHYIKQKLFVHSIIYSIFQLDGS